MSVDPEPGDFAGWIVGMPGPDVDYALCLAREGGEALLRFQVHQQPGPWKEEWVAIKQRGKRHVWKTERAAMIGKALRDERARLFRSPPAQETTDG